MSSLLITQRARFLQSCKNLLYKSPPCLLLNQSARKSTILNDAYENAKAYCKSNISHLFFTNVHEVYT